MTAVLWLPGRPLHSSDEAWALADLTPPEPTDTDPWETSCPGTSTR